MRTHHDLIAGRDERVDKRATVAREQAVAPPCGGEQHDRQVMLGSWRRRASRRHGVHVRAAHDLDLLGRPLLRALEPADLGDHVLAGHEAGVVEGEAEHAVARRGTCRMEAVCVPTHILGALPLEHVESGGGREAHICAHHIEPRECLVPLPYELARHMLVGFFERRVIRRAGPVRRIDASTFEFIANRFEHVPVALMV